MDLLVRTSGASSERGHLLALVLKYAEEAVEYYHGNNLSSLTLTNPYVSMKGFITIFRQSDGRFKLMAAFDQKTGEEWNREPGKKGKQKKALLRQPTRHAAE